MATLWHRSCAARQQASVHRGKRLAKTLNGLCRSTIQQRVLLVIARVALVPTRKGKGADGSNIEPQIEFRFDEFISSRRNTIWIPEASGGKRVAHRHLGSDSKHCARAQVAGRIEAALRCCRLRVEAFGLHLLPQPVGGHVVSRSLGLLPLVQEPVAAAAAAT